MSRKSAFVIRAKPHGTNREQQFLGGTASIGWPRTGSLKGADRAAIERALKVGHSDSATSLSMSQIYNFVHLAVGSLVLTPSYETRDIHLFRTKSAYHYRKAWVEAGNPHTIAVEHLKTVSRDVFPEDVRKALLAAKKTVTDFSKYEAAISAIADARNLDPGGHTATTEISGLREEAVRTLRELLSSKNERIRLQAALALVDQRP